MDFGGMGGMDGPDSDDDDDGLLSFFFWPRIMAPFARSPP
jgi:hypothetical protein